jgi:hypothetical protein
MPTADAFAVAIKARFSDDLAGIAKNIADGAAKAWELDDLTIFEETITLVEQDAQYRLELATESAGWQGYQVGRVDAIAEGGDGFRWILDPGAQHCDDCISRSQGGPYTFDELVETVGIPGDAPTECDGGCRCSLEAA